MRYLVLFFVLLTFVHASHSQTYDWTKTFGGSNVDLAFASATDDSGYVYVGGMFGNTVDFDPGPAAEVRTVSGVFYDLFIQKLDSMGNLIWVKTFDGAAFNSVHSMTVDNKGDLVAAGSFSGTIDFDPGPGNETHIASGLDGFVLKLNSSGNFIWCSTISGFGDQKVFSLATNAAGALFLTGTFNLTPDFDPGPGLAEDTSQLFTPFDAYVLKLNSDGSFAWVKTFGGNENDIGRSISVDKEGNIYTTGEFMQVVDFDPGASTSVRNSNDATVDIYILKLNPEGDFVWVRTFGSARHDNAWYIETDDLGNVYVAGNVFAACDFDPGAGIAAHTVKGDADGYLSKFDSNGNFNWVKVISGDGFDSAGPIFIDNGNVYLAGTFMLGVNFNNSDPAYFRVASGNRDAFLARYKEDGSISWIKTFGGSYSISSAHLSIDKLGNIYLVGDYSGTADFDPGAGTDMRTSHSPNSDYYVWKLKHPFCSFLQGIPSEDIICGEGSSVLLDAKNSGNKYVWSTGATTQTISITEENYYSVKIYNDSCSKVDSIKIKKHIAPYLGRDTVLCETNPLLVGVNSSWNEYIWSTNETTPSIQVNSAGKYWVTVKELSCILSDTIHVNYSILNLNLGVDTILCGGHRSIILNAQNPGNNFSWSTGEKTQIIEANATGDYFVTVSNDFCIKKDSINILKLFAPDLGKDIVLCNNKEYLLSADPVWDSYNWSSGEVGSTVSVKETGTYSVIVTKSHCTLQSDTIRAIKFDPSQVFVPNLITPNKDDKNDFLIIQNNPIKSNLSIYSRWGQQVLEDSDYKDQWDGDGLSEGLYYYSLENECGIIRVGWIEIKK